MLKEKIKKVKFLKSIYQNNLNQQVKKQTIKNESKKHYNKFNQIY